MKIEIDCEEDRKWITSSTQSVCSIFASFLLVLLGLSQSALGEEGKATRIDPKAEKIVRKVSDYAISLKSWTVNATMSMNMEARGMKQEMSADYAIAMQRPNKLSMVVTNGFLGSTLVCDGKKLYTLMPMMNQYTVQDAPGEMSSILGENAMSMMGGGMGGLFMDSLTASKPYNSLMEGVTNGQYLGLEQLEGAKCHRLKFSQEEFDWEMWVQDGPRPWVQKVVADMSKSLSAAGERMPGMKDMKMLMTIRYANWTANPTLAEDAFKFTPPAGAKAVESFFAGMVKEQPSVLLGKPAPEFKLDLLDSGQLELKTHKGKEIVVLDFWATWCGPCRKSLPMLTEVVEEYKDKGVVFYGVDQREDAEKIRGFLKKTGLKFAVLLDKDGKVGEQYGVKGIPQTVIIGKDGSVQVVHTGLLPNLKAKLKGELDALLAGKNLAVESNPKKPETQPSGVTPGRGL